MSTECAYKCLFDIMLLQRKNKQRQRSYGHTKCLIKSYKYILSNPLVILVLIITSIIFEQLGIREGRLKGADPANTWESGIITTRHTNDVYLSHYWMRPLFRCSLCFM